MAANEIEWKVMRAGESDQLIGEEGTKKVPLIGTFTGIKGGTFLWQDGRLQ